MIATVCSKWAERRPSAVAAVQQSGRNAISQPPAFTMGSIANTMPSRRRWPSVVVFVLVVAAAEVVVGLGIIVALLRKQPAATADDVNVLKG